MAVGDKGVNVCVFGLWHLGAVTAACLAAQGHRVKGLDFDLRVIEQLSRGNPPLHEPGLTDLVQRGIAAGNLQFTAEPSHALVGAEVLWVTIDTPVDEQDRADVESVVTAVERVLPLVESGCIVIISSQLPVGTTRRLKERFATVYPDRHVAFVYSPENLRLGTAIASFTHPDRIVIGIEELAEDAARARVTELFAPLGAYIEWMSIESAEMVKHALNAFLATEIGFINEIAQLCEQTGADAAEVERGLKSDSRIGAGAYLRPGAAFAGGTLARDLVFLKLLGSMHGISTPLLAGVRASNDAHKGWIIRKLEEMLGELGGRNIALWGLTYKPDTDILRRSAAVELFRQLLLKGSRVWAYDPAVHALPPELESVALAASALEAVRDADALVVATEWSEFRSISSEDVAAAMRRRLVLDPNRFLVKTLAVDPRFTYAAVGMPSARANKRE